MSPPALPKLEQVAVVALATNWRIAGETVVLGKKYAIDADVAADLIARGKARRA